MSTRKTYARTATIVAIGASVLAGHLAATGPAVAAAPAATVTPSPTPSPTPPPAPPEERAVYDVLREAGGVPVVSVQQAELPVAAVPEKNIEAVTQAQQNAKLLDLLQADASVKVFSKPQVRRPAHHKPLPATTDPLLRAAEHHILTHTLPAWERTTGRGQLVAVLDTGVDTTHPELRGAVVDALDFAEGAAPGTHGTDIAALIAGRLNNGVAAAGVAPDASLLSVRVCQDDGACPTSAIATGIVEAVEAGADVLNISVGGAKPSAVEQYALRWAVRQGAVVVAAAGNSAIACDTGQEPEENNCGNAVNYPGGYEEALTVTSTRISSPQGLRFGEETTGPQVDLSAPGHKVRAGIAASAQSAALLSGSSLSAAQVSGAVALMRAADPTLTPARVEQVLRQTARTSWPLAGHSYVGSGRGAGLVDVDAAVAAVAARDTVTRTASGAEFRRNDVTVTVKGAILARYDALGAEKGALGWPLSNELSAPGELPAGGGVISHFERGSIIWSPATGARVLKGAISSKVRAMIQEQTTASVLHPAKRADVYLGYPTSEEVAVRGGVVQHFQGGLVYWSPATGAQALRGAILEQYGRSGHESGRLGYPVTSEVLLPKGAFAAFQGGSVYWSPRTGSHVVLGAIRDSWGSTGWENGLLGYPVSGEYPVAGGVRQDFQGGALVFSAGTGKVTAVRR
ncbi:LGFP repeat-containing protein [Kineococcus xinjiangensis]|uniref:LGFP repeat-containing protein n=1 Tax=Kineococcus xinjiangensis TaxID=512762 RepID=A0A2S6IPI6_9ACTN|nr:S8 family serine peptidase [Kineococcus xinjiangensis]PPK96006.1 LGFP repeat-containing protein [Kineococcus xinjiangensis]